MVWLTRGVLLVLALLLATQLINGLRAWRDEAVAASWIDALKGKRECFGDLTLSEAERLEHLTTVATPKLSFEDRWRVDCYLRDVDRRRTVDRAEWALIDARTKIKNALIYGTVTLVVTAILAMLGWISRNKAAKRESSSRSTD